MNRAGRVAQWLNDLAALTAGRAPLADSKTKIAALSSLIAQNYDPAVFCQASLVQVARNLAFFPSYAELCDQLDAWWKDHKPRAAELPPQRDPWAERVAREREEAAASWRTITPEEVRAKIALVREVPPGALQSACGALLAVALRTHAPQLLALLPPAWLEDRRAAPSPTAAAAKPRFLTPEQLQAQKAQREKQPA